MSDLSQPSEQDLQDLAALADGSLAEARRAEVEARVRASPELAQELDRQRRALDLVIAAQRQVGAPAAVREHVAAEQTRRRPLFSFGRVGLAAGGVAIAAVALVVVLLVVPGSVSGDQVIAQAAAAHAKPVERPAPQERSPTLLDFQRFGVTFPAWRTTFRWDAVGERADRSEGRDIATVLFRKGEDAVGYSVISGDRFDPPKGARSVEHEGSMVWVSTQGARTIVMFNRQGRTCVVSAVGVPEATLVELAAWKGKGTVPFSETL